VRQPLPTGRCFDWRDAALDQVLVNATRLVKAAQRRFVPVDDVSTLGVIETLIIDAGKPVDDAEVPSLRDEGLVIDEPPERNQAASVSHCSREDGSVAFDDLETGAARRVPETLSDRSKCRGLE